MRTLLAAALSVALLGCKREPPVVDAGPPRCGPFACVHGTSIEALLAPVRAPGPVVIAFGEAHARADLRGKAPVERFREEILPAIAAADQPLVIELVAPDPRCAKGQVAGAQATGAEISAGQRQDNQKGYVGLGAAAKQRGLRPSLLVPSCEALAAVGAGRLDGGTDVAAMLTMIADLAFARAKEELPKATSGAPVLLYGGALHNDLAPRPGTEDFSFGPRLAAATGDRYAEVDVVLPEQIDGTDVWKRLPWYPHYRAETQGDEAWLYTIAPGRYVLFLRR